jgi:hypothetical protein
MNSLSPRQDYIVLPDQIWLDGIATSPGIVKQFVATKLAPRRQRPAEYKPATLGSSGQASDSQAPSSGRQPLGATVEWQVTGQDAVGGFQLQLIPEFDLTKMSATSESDVCAPLDSDEKSYSLRKSGKARRYDMLQTPEELDLHVGDVLHIKDMARAQPDRQKRVGDLYLEAGIKKGSAESITIEIVMPEALDWHFTVRKHREPRTSMAIDVSTYFLKFAHDYWLTESVL